MAENNRGLPSTRRRKVPGKKSLTQKFRRE